MSDLVRDELLGQLFRQAATEWAKLDPPVPPEDVLYSLGRHGYDIGYAQGVREALLGRAGFEALGAIGRALAIIPVLAAGLPYVDRGDPVWGPRDREYYDATRRAIYLGALRLYVERDRPCPAYLTGNFERVCHVFGRIGHVIARGRGGPEWQAHRSAITIWSKWA